MPPWQGHFWRNSESLPTHTASSNDCTDVQADVSQWLHMSNEPAHDKKKKWHVPSKGSDQSGHPAVWSESLCCPHEESLGSQLPTECTAKTLIRVGGCPGWSESSLDAHAISLICREAAPWLSLGRIAKTDQTMRMHPLIWVFAWPSRHLVVFIMLWLNCKISRQYWGFRLLLFLFLLFFLIFAEWTCPSLSTGWIPFEF